MENQLIFSQPSGEPIRYMLQLSDAPQADALLAYLATLDFITLSPVQSVDDMTADDYRRNAQRKPLRMVAKSI